MKPSPERVLRSQPTRDRILNAARFLFAERGFEKTTIRGVASAAAINPSMVIRYYGSKEELFAAAAKFDFRMPDLAALPPTDRGIALVRHVIDRWEGSGASVELQALLRAAGTHPSARLRLSELVEQQAVPVIKSVLPRDHKRDRLGLIIIQLAGLVMSRYFLRHPSVTVLAREEIIRQVGAAVQGYLTEPVKAPKRR